MNRVVAKDTIERDLQSTRRDFACRAIVFLHKVGCPYVPPESLTRENLQQEVTKFREWYEAQQNKQGLLKKYDKHVQFWSPMYVD